MSPLESTNRHRSLETAEMSMKVKGWRAALLAARRVVALPRIHVVFVPVGRAVLVEAHLDGAVGSVRALVGGGIAESIALLEPVDDGLHRRGNGDAVAGVDHFAAGLVAD